MDQLIELLQQIQDLAGAGIDALRGASEGGPPPEGGPAEGGPPPEGGAPEEQGAPPA